MTTRRIYAADTSVPVDRTRAEIRDLLSSWGCSGMGWTDHFREGDVELGFVWDPAVVARQGVSATRCRRHYLNTCAECGWKDGFKDLGDHVLFRVRMRLKVGTDPQKQRSAHRLLLLKIKADLNAAQAGLAKAEEVFLPWIVDAAGTTVSEHVLPRLKQAYAALPPGPKENQ